MAYIVHPKQKASQGCSPMMLKIRSLIALALLSFPIAACATDVAEEDTDASEDEVVATFDSRGQIDLNKTSRILLVGDSSHLGELPLWSATTKARRMAQLYPNDQIVLFITEDVRDSSLPSKGATVVRQEPFGSSVALSDLRRLTAPKLVAALQRFNRIAAIEFFGHSSPFGALLEDEGSNRVLNAGIPSNMAALKAKFARDANPYVALNGCNGGTTLAPELSKLWEVPVSGALTGSNFQALMSDGKWYPNDVGFYPPELTAKTTNDKSFGAQNAVACSKGACMRMKPQDSPYRGIWADPTTGFQYGLGYYKFFCNYNDTQNTCAKGMATSLYAFPSTRPIDKNSSDADFKEVVADFLCNTAKDGTWFDQCKTQLFAAAANNAAFSSMKSANDYSLECDFAKCEQKFRCTMVDGAPQKKSCAWVSSTCRADQSLASCRPKNTTKQTTVRELKKYLEGHALLRGS
jgi:hypothetical protein